MSIVVQCDCGKKYKIGNDKAGKKIRCKECGGVVEIPFSSTTPVDEWDDVAAKKTPPPHPNSIGQSKKTPPPHPNSIDQGTEGNQPTESGSKMSSAVKYSIFAAGGGVIIVGIVAGILVLSGIFGGGKKDHIDQVVGKKDTNVQPDKKPSPPTVTGDRSKLTPLQALHGHWKLSHAYKHNDTNLSDGSKGEITEDLTGKGTVSHRFINSKTGTWVELKTGWPTLRYSFSVLPDDDYPEKFRLLLDGKPKLDHPYYLSKDNTQLDEQWVRKFGRGWDAERWVYVDDTVSPSQSLLSLLKTQAAKSKTRKAAAKAVERIKGRNQVADKKKPTKKASAENAKSKEEKRDSLLVLGSNDSIHAAAGSRGRYAKVPVLLFVDGTAQQDVAFVLVKGTDEGRQNLAALGLLKPRATTTGTELTVVISEDLVERITKWVSANASPNTRTFRELVLDDWEEWLHPSKTGDAELDKKSAPATKSTNRSANRIPATSKLFDFTQPISFLARQSGHSSDQKQGDLQRQISYLAVAGELVSETSKDNERTRLQAKSIIVGLVPAVGTDKSLLSSLGIKACVFSAKRDVETALQILEIGDGARAVVPAIQGKDTRAKRAEQVADYWAVLASCDEMRIKQANGQLSVQNEKVQAQLVSHRIPDELPMGVIRKKLAQKLNSSVARRDARSLETIGIPLLNAAVQVAGGSTDLLADLTTFDQHWGRLVRMSPAGQQVFADHVLKKVLAVAVNRDGVHVLSGVELLYFVDNASFLVEGPSAELKMHRRDLENVFLPVMTSGAFLPERMSAYSTKPWDPHKPKRSGFTKVVTRGGSGPSGPRGLPPLSKRDPFICYGYKGKIVKELPKGQKPISISNDGFLIPAGRERISLDDFHKYSGDGKAMLLETNFYRVERQDNPSFEDPKTASGKIDLKRIQQILEEEEKKNPKRSRPRQRRETDRNFNGKAFEAALLTHSRADRAGALARDDKHKSYTKALLAWQRDYERQRESALQMVAAEPKFKQMLDKINETFEARADKKLAVLSKARDEAKARAKTASPTKKVATTNSEGVIYLPSPRYVRRRRLESIQKLDASADARHDTFKLLGPEGIESFKKKMVEVYKEQREELLKTLRD